MKKLNVGLALLFMLGLAATSQADSISFSNSSNTAVTFTGSLSGTTFTFQNATPDSTLLPGYTLSISGIYTFGSQISSEYWSVTGTGILTLSNGPDILMGTVSMVDIQGIGSIAGNNAGLAMNLTGVSVTGSNPLLTQFLPGGVLNTTYQFNFGSAVSTLAGLGNGATQTNSYSGQMAPVPEPASLLLLGSGLLGGYMLTRRKR